VARQGSARIPANSKDLPIQVLDSSSIHGRRAWLSIREMT
jgi:hypothetical protein